MGKEIISFYDFMVSYPHQLPERIALAAELQRLVPAHNEVKEIDSMVDLMLVSELIQNSKAFKAISGGLWCEYCAVSGHPLVKEI